MTQTGVASPTVERPRARGVAKTLIKRRVDAYWISSGEHNLVDLIDFFPAVVS